MASRLRITVSVTARRIVPFRSRSRLAGLAFRRYKHDTLDELGRRSKGLCYPVYQQQVLESRYRIAAKLGFTIYSSEWLTWDQQDEKYVTIKIFNTNISNTGEGAVPPGLSEAIAMAQRRNGNHPGSTMVRPLIHSFHIEGPKGTHRCVVSHLARPIALHQGHGKMHMLPLQRLLRSVLQGLDFLHSEAGIMYGGRIRTTDLCYVLGNDERPKAIDQGMQLVKEPHNVVDNHPLYQVQLLKPNEGDFLENDIVMTVNDYATFVGNTPERPEGEGVSYNIRSQQAPEIILEMPVGPPADIWAFAVLAYSLLHKEGLFKIIVDRVRAIPGDSGYRPFRHMALINTLLGPPPADFVTRSESCLQCFDESGNWIAPEETNAAAAKVTSDIVSRFHRDFEVSATESQKEYLLDLIISALKWRPEDRPTASQLLQHPFFKIEFGRPKVPEAEAVTCSRPHGSLQKSSLDTSPPVSHDVDDIVAPARSSSGTMFTVDDSKPTDTNSQTYPSAGHRDPRAASPPSPPRKDTSSQDEATPMASPATGYESPPTAANSPQPRTKREPERSLDGRPKPHSEIVMALNVSKDQLRNNRDLRLMPGARLNRKDDRYDIKRTTAVSKPQRPSGPDTSRDPPASDSTSFLHGLLEPRPKSDRTLPPLPPGGIPQGPLSAESNVRRKPSLGMSWAEMMTPRKEPETPRPRNPKWVRGPHDSAQTEDPLMNLFGSSEGHNTPGRTSVPHPSDASGDLLSKLYNISNSRNDSKRSHSKGKPFSQSSATPRNSGFSRISEVINSRKDSGRSPPPRKTPPPMRQGSTPPATDGFAQMASLRRDDREMLGPTPNRLLGMKNKNGFQRRHEKKAAQSSRGPGARQQKKVDPNDPWAVMSSTRRGA